MLILWQGFLLFFFLLKPLSANALSKKHRAQEAFAEKKYDLAVTQYEELLEKKPEDDDSQFFLASSLFKLERYEEALLHFEKILERQTSKESKVDLELQQKIFYNLGVVLYKLKRFDEAVSYFHAALVLNPNDDKAKHNLVLAQKESPPKAKPLSVSFDALDASFDDAKPPLNSKDNQMKNLSSSSALSRVLSNGIAIADINLVSPAPKSSSTQIDAEHIKKIESYKAEKLKLAQEQERIKREIEKLQLQRRGHETQEQTEESEARNQVMSSRAKLKEFESLAGAWKPAKYSQDDRKKDLKSSELGASSTTSTKENSELLKKLFSETMSQYYVTPSRGDLLFQDTHRDLYKEEQWSAKDLNYSLFEYSEKYSLDKARNTVFVNGVGVQHKGYTYYKLPVIDGHVPHPQSLLFDNPEQFHSYRILKNPYGDYLLEVKDTKDLNLKFKYSLVQHIEQDRFSETDKEPLNKIPEDLLELSKKFVHPEMTTLEKAEALRALLRERGIYTKDNNTLDAYINTSDTRHGSKVKRLSNLLLQNEELPSNLRGLGMDCDCWAELYISLARHYGIPSRLRTGFLANDGPKLSSENRHGWPAIYNEQEKRWVSMDPTPNQQDDLSIKLRELETQLSKSFFDSKLLKEPPRITYKSPERLRTEHEVELKKLREKVFDHVVNVSRMHSLMLSPEFNQQITNEQYQKIKEDTILKAKQLIARAKLKSASDAYKREHLNAGMRLLAEFINVGMVDHSGEIKTLIEEAQALDNTIPKTNGLFQVLAYNKKGRLVSLNNKIFWMPDDSFYLEEIPIDFSNAIRFFEAVISEDGKHYAIATKEKGGELKVYHNGKAYTREGDFIGQLKFEDLRKDIFYTVVSNTGGVDSDEQLYKNNEPIIKSTNLMRVSSSHQPYYILGGSGYIEKVLNGDKTLFEELPPDKRISSFALSPSGDELVVFENTHLFQQAVREGKQSKLKGAREVFLNGKLIENKMPFIRAYSRYKDGSLMFYKEQEHQDEDDKKNKIILKNNKLIIAPNLESLVEKSEEDSIIEREEVEDGYLYYLQDSQGRKKPLVFEDGRRLKTTEGQHYRFLGQKTIGNLTHDSEVYLLDLGPNTGIVSPKSTFNDPLGQEFRIKNVSESFGQKYNLFAAVADNGDAIVVENNLVVERLPLINTAAEEEIAPSGSRSAYSDVITQTAPNKDRITSITSGLHSNKAEHILTINGAEVMRIPHSGVFSFGIETDSKRSDIIYRATESVQAENQIQYVSQDASDEAYEELKAKRIASLENLEIEIAPFINKPSLNVYDLTFLTRNMLYHKSVDGKAATPWLNLTNKVYEKPLALLEAKLSDSQALQTVLLPFMTSSEIILSQKQEDELVELAHKWGLIDKITNHFYHRVDLPGTPLLDERQQRFLTKLGIKKHGQLLP